MKRIILLIVLFFNISFLNSQTLKMILKITDDDTIRHNNLKYIISITDYNKDTTYTYITPSNYILLFEYNNMYRINITGNDMSEYDIHFINQGPIKNYLMNLIIPLKSDRTLTVKKLIYYLNSKERYYIDPL